jgi:hypothetical protein
MSVCLFVSVCLSVVYLHTYTRGVMILSFRRGVTLTLYSSRIIKREVLTLSLRSYLLRLYLHILCVFTKTILLHDICFLRV